MRDDDDLLRHGAQPVALAGERLWLLPERAVWWPAAAMLFVADLHIGKAAHFRALGQPVPVGTTTDTLSRLDAVLLRYPARELVVLGDFVHAAHSLTQGRDERVAAWRAAHASVGMRVVLGNHDRHLACWPESLAIRPVEEPHALVSGAPLVACHHPDHAAPPPGVGVLAGHLHPSITLQGRGRDRVRVPCFALAGEVLVLPAFGAFTGTMTAALPGRTRYWTAAGGAVHAVPAPVPTQVPGTTALRRGTSGR